MLDRVRERIHPQELVQARAAAEAAPLPRPVRRPAGSARPALDYLTATAPVDGPVSHHSRYSVRALVPAGQLAVVPLPDAAETVIADVRAAMACSPRSRKAGC